MPAGHRQVALPAHGFAATANLPRLSWRQRLCICNCVPYAKGPSQAPGAAPPGQPALSRPPSGCWLGGLSHDALFGSLDVLPAATRLESLHILRQSMPAAPPPGELHPRSAALYSWLCCHLPLRLLVFDCHAAVSA